MVQVLLLRHWPSIIAHLLKARFSADIIVSVIAYHADVIWVVAFGFTASVKTCRVCRICNRINEKKLSMGSVYIFFTILTHCSKVLH